MEAIEVGEGGESDSGDGDGDGDGDGEEGESSAGGNKESGEVCVTIYGHVMYVCMCVCGTVCMLHLCQ